MLLIFSSYVYVSGVLSPTLTLVVLDAYHCFLIPFVTCVLRLLVYVLLCHLLKKSNYFPSTQIVIDSLLTEEFVGGVYI